MNYSKAVAKQALIDAGATALYVAAIALFMANAEKAFMAGPENQALGITLFLLLFVFSAACCATFVFGKPVMWYLDGKRKEAFQLLQLTIVFLFVIVLALVGTLSAIS